MFRENQQIGGYTLIKQIGRGGFGEVWLGRIRDTPAQVAIKLPNLEQDDFEVYSSTSQIMGKRLNR